MTTFTIQDLCNALPTTPEEDEMFKQMETIGLKEAQMGEPLPNADIPTIINTICTQLQLLATVINQHQPNTTPPEGDPPSLQETIALTLQQADWFKDMVKEAVEESIDNGNFEDAVSSQVGSCVDSYFCHDFSLSDHCDIDSMVSGKVDDCLEEVVAEKLSEANVSISF